MQRITSLMRVLPGKEEAFAKELASCLPEILARAGAWNASVWGVSGFAFFYAEAPDDCFADALRLDDRIGGTAVYIAPPGEMRLMYHDIGVVRQDKSLIRHRVFATVLKDGCAETYKARHDRLIGARDGKTRLGPESNFTIWCARNRYIFGYCELVKAYDHAPTPEETAASAAWETRQLEIMDWLTDDVDWLTKSGHPRMERLY